MTKILYIHGDEYGASNYEEVIANGEISAAELWHLSDTRDWSEWNDKFNFVALEFDDIDPRFIDFIKDEFIDYDSRKSYNIYVVE